MTQPTYQPTWDLESIFPGGSASPALAAHLDLLAQDIPALKAALSAVNTSDVATWRRWLAEVQAVSARLSQAAAFTSCLTAQNVKDDKAKQILAQVRSLSAAYAAALIQLDTRMLELSDAQWAAVLADPAIVPVAGPLAVRRRRAAEKMAPELETLAAGLTVDGYHGWNNLYNIVVGRMSMPVQRNGQTEDLSMGQAQNRMKDPDPAVRTQVFTKWEQAWQGESELIASGLNHLAGYRIALYKQRGWESPLHEALTMSNLSQATLDAMWGAISAAKQPFVAYLQRKAHLLGVARCSWHDVEAPLALGAGDKRSYTDGAAFILEHFRRFNPAMADFAQRAFEQRWIEAEDRAGKRPGGFYTNFPLSHQGRIFMTYDGAPGTVSTLAHELGHAYHSHVLENEPILARSYGMCLAETASTFAEMIVADAAVQQAPSDAERIVLLEDKLQSSVAFLMNIHARYLFETRFYAARAQGVLTAAELNELMLAAQQEAFAGALSEYHPTFWAAKMHFHNTGVPFYNFPYTFGYLFSAGIYAQALAEGPAFAAKYDDLLRDTGRLSVEEVAARHLGVDTTQPAFWERAVGLAIADAQEFLRLTDSLVR